MDRNKERERDRQIDRSIERKKDRQKDRWIERKSGGCRECFMKYVEGENHVNSWPRFRNSFKSLVFEQDVDQWYRTSSDTWSVWAQSLLVDPLGFLYHKHETNLI